jgi:hypothetical protein
MEAEGDTALWDALALANDQLSEYGKKFPEAKKRIVCLSDGVDNKSSKRVRDVGDSLYVCTLIKRLHQGALFICCGPDVFNSKTK